MSWYWWVLLGLIGTTVWSMVWMDYTKRRNNINRIVRGIKERGPLFRWEVTISYLDHKAHGDQVQNQTLEVLAPNEEEAIGIAMEDADLVIPWDEVVDTRAERFNL